MIQAKELRLGNWIKVYGDVTCAWNLSSDDDVNDEGNGDHIQPIPLTPEILEKCGFVLTDDGISPYWRLELMRTEVISIEDDWSVGLNAANENSTMGYATGPGRCQYLHQLQNLYFALTGNELNYQP